MVASRRIQPWSLWLIVALLLGGIVVSINYLKRNRSEAHDPRPPFLGKLERDMTATNRDGSTIHLRDLRGEIWIASYLYTGSPGKAQAMARQLKTTWEEFGTNPRLHLVTLSADPSGDTPEKRNVFIQTYGVDDPRWWFLTGKPEELSRFAVRYLRMMPPRPARDPASVQEWGPVMHDVRVALIDGKANLRGLYQLLDPRTGELQSGLLKRDLQYLLEGQ